MSYDAVILGLGYVGLPLAQQAIRAGMSVLGFDVNLTVEQYRRQLARVGCVMIGQTAEIAPKLAALTKGS